MNPKIAVITAAYNTEKYIKSAIDSILHQDYDGEIHHYIIDDASTDNIVEIIRSQLINIKENTTFDYYKISGYYNALPVTLISLKKNGKQGRARNFGIKEAWKWADAFVILDADDYKYPNFISEHVKAWQQDPNSIGVVYSDYNIFHVDMNEFVREFKRSYDRDLLHRECIVSSGALISKEAMGFAGLFMEDTFNVEDYGQWLKISNKYIMKHIPKSLWCYRVTGNNSTSSTNNEQIKLGYQRMGENYNNWLKNPVGYQDQ